MTDEQVATVTVIIIAVVLGMVIGTVRLIKRGLDDMDYTDWNNHV